MRYWIKHFQFLSAFVFRLKGLCSLLNGLYVAVDVLMHHTTIWHTYIFWEIEWIVKFISPFFRTCHVVSLCVYFRFSETILFSQFRILWNNVNSFYNKNCCRANPYTASTTKALILVSINKQANIERCNARWKDKHNEVVICIYSVVWNRISGVIKSNLH